MEKKEEKKETTQTGQTEPKIGTVSLNLTDTWPANYVRICTYPSALVGVNLTTGVCKPQRNLLILFSSLINDLSGVEVGNLPDALEVLKEIAPELKPGEGERAKEGARVFFRR